MGCWQVSSMRVVSSCGCEGGVGGKEGLVEAFVKWREQGSNVCK